jgi:hypothetical protein
VRLVEQHLLRLLARSLEHEIGAALALQLGCAVDQLALHCRRAKVDDGGG